MRPKGFPSNSAAYNAGDTGLIPGSGSSPGEGIGYTPVFWGFPGSSHGKKSTCIAGELGWEDSLEEGMTTHSSILALRIPWTEEPGRPQSMGSQRARHE